jgi:hypothetical protein
MIAKMPPFYQLLDLTELTEEGLHEAKIQAEELLQNIENEVNLRVYQGD